MDTLSLINFEKYYNLEEFLFNEVRYNFHKRKPKHLTPFEILSIVIWKAERNKKRVKSSLLKEGVVNTISNTLRNYQQGKEEDVVEELTKIYGIGIPTASAFLTVLYPSDFTVVDVRAKETFENHPHLKNYCKGKNCFISNPSENVKGYIDYLNKCKKASVNFGFKDLRAFDKAIWGYSFFSDLSDYVKDI